MIAEGPARPGLPQTGLGDVFALFHRLAAGTGGSPLGVAIVRTIVTDHGGSISLGTRRPHGLCAELRLPL